MCCFSGVRNRGECFSSARTPNALPSGACGLPPVGGGTGHGTGVSPPGPKLPVCSPWQGPGEAVSEAAQRSVKSAQQGVEATAPENTAHALASSVGTATRRARLRHRQASTGQQTRATQRPSQGKSMGRVCTGLEAHKAPGAPGAGLTGRH